MNYEHLRTIIKNIKQQMTCSHCQANFINEDIQVVSVNNNKAIMVIRCNECGGPVMITASLTSGKISNTSKEDMIEVLPQLEDIPECTAEHGEILVDDVVDIHEYLKNFEGSFSEVFEKEE